MYSSDRWTALKSTISCLEKMPIFNQCQKTLIVDEQVENLPLNWNVIPIPRKNGKFCWGRAWDAGVASAQCETVIYLDSDRLLPPNFLDKVHKTIGEKTFLFTSQHYMMLREIPINDIHKFLTCNNPLEMINNDEYIGFARYEPRSQKPVHGPSKNVMSGSCAFTRNTYWNIGGVDHWYCGHGAFADNDFHMQATKHEIKFIDLNLTELHYPHGKKEDGNNLSNEDLYRLSLDNFIYYCWKWKLPLALAESFAHRCKISRPTRYVDKKMKELKANAKEFERINVLYR